MENVDWTALCRAYDELKKGFLSMKYSEEEAGKAAANIMAAMMMAGQINKSRAEIKEIVFCEK